MISAKSLLLVSAAGAAGVFASPASDCHASPTLEWGDCDMSVNELAEGAELQAEYSCANMTVPLSYTDCGSNKTHVLEMIKIHAPTEGESMGSIIFNFGGPGDNGVDQMAAGGDMLLNRTGGQHDIITFKPRGTSVNHLHASCFDTDLERSMTLRANPYHRMVTSLSDEDQAEVAWEHLLAEAEVYANNCADKLKDVGPYIGTASVARDVMSIVDALGDEKLNYWGISYGTVLGATLAGMFPDRMGHVILDAVANPSDFFYDQYGPQNFEDLDGGFKGLLDACVEAGTDVCPLAEYASSGDELEEVVYDLFDSIAQKPLVWPTELANYTLISAGTILDIDTLKGAIFSVMYTPEQYPIITTALAGLLEDDMTAVTPLRAAQEDKAALQKDEALPAIRCGDVVMESRDPSIETVRAGFEKMMNSSSLVDGSATAYLTTLQCAHWKMDLDERYEGGFDIDMSDSPLLVIGNTYDPVTPLSSAKNVTNDFGGSVLVHNDGFGHASNAHPSSCVQDIAIKYLQEGELPDSGTICEPDMSLAEIMEKVKELTDEQDEE